jgi:hypothetical protein
MSELEARVRECATLSSLTLRQLRTTITRLQAFQTTAKNIESAFQQTEETADSISQTLSEWQDIQQLFEEAKDLIKKLNVPGDPRLYLSQMDRAKQLIVRFDKRKDISEAATMAGQLTQYVGVAVAHCHDLIRKLLIEYHQLYSVTPIGQEEGRTSTLETLELLVRAAGHKGQVEIRKLYAQLRGKMLLAYIKQSPSQLSVKYERGSYFLIKIVGALLEAMAVEVQLEQVVFRKQVVEDLLGEAVEEPFKFLIYNLESFFQGDLPIIICFDILGTLHQAVPAVSSLLGKSGKLYTLNKMYSLALSKCQNWYRDLLNTIQTSKSPLSDTIDANTYTVYRYLVQLVDYTDVLEVCQLLTQMPTLVTSLLQSLRQNLRPHLNKQSPIARIAIVNNIAFWLGQEELYPILPQAFLAELKKELIGEIQQFTRQTWQPLETTMGEQEGVIEFTKSGALARRSRKAVKEKFNTFNGQFAALISQHSALGIYHEEVLATLRKLAFDFFYPKYQAFMKKFYPLDFTTRKQKYLVHSEEEVAGIVQGLYQLRKA